jgi:hypothetical protein
MMTGAWKGGIGALVDGGKHALIKRMHPIVIVIDSRFILYLPFYVHILPCSLMSANPGREYRYISVCLFNCWAI